MEGLKMYEWILNRDDINSTEKLVLARLLALHEMKPCEKVSCEVNYSEVAKYLNISRASVKRACDRLTSTLDLMILTVPGKCNTFVLFDRKNQH
jgi:DNA-binding MarR family transcriptional regulator